MRRSLSNSWRNYSGRDTNSSSAPFNASETAIAEVEGKKEEEERIKTSGPYPLSNSWTFYRDKYVANATPEEYAQNLVVLATVATVQNFWAVYNNIPGPDQLQSRCSHHFMKSGIRPVWEDPRNENGGAWYFRVDKSDTAFVWRELLMQLIGEQFEDCIAEDDDIFGLSVSSRYNTDIFTMWNQNANAPNLSKVLDKLLEILKPVQLQLPYYKAHKDHSSFKKSDSPAANGQMLG
ncbi:2735_t:CDS:2 [Paraglomus occultum]|uniref:2735_t:CDS:1 n=1 Tax=Paraglomus occultum TaxID=144539 RepID=A0A9N9BAK1_9GLOM|nr:2735_t:CDS:2 [Paraglomus occultum]